MTRFRKKPVEVDAEQLTRENIATLNERVPGKPYYAADSTVSGMTIFGPDGREYAAFGDWIINHGKGVFRRCSPDEFAAEYEPVDADGAYDTIPTEQPAVIDPPLPEPLNDEEAAKRDAGGDYRAADGKLVGYCPPGQS